MARTRQRVFVYGLLRSDQSMHDLLEGLRERFETIVLDCPPVLGLPDATILTDLCDAALLVVGAGASSRRQIESALERIDRSRLLGVVFNRGKEDVDKDAQRYAQAAARRG